MVVSCEQVWRQVSNYLEGDLDPALKAALDEHLKGCKRCTAVVEGTRNIIAVYGDERLQEVPFGFGQRLHRKLEEQMPGRRGSAFGWVLVFAAILLIVGSVRLGRSAVFYNPELRSEHADPARTSIPDNMLVLVSDDGKVFHGGGRCPFIHDKAHLRTMTAAEAIREGYAPCTRCMRQYMAVNGAPMKDFDADEDLEAGLGASR